MTTHPPVVLVHGWGGSFRRTWGDTALLPLLDDAGRQVIGVDLLGHGEAPKPHEPEAYQDMTGRIVEALPDGPVDLVGFSLGAITSLLLACRQPERFNRLVVAGIGETIFGLAHGLGPKIADAIRTGGDPADASVQAFVRYANEPGNDPLALAACMERPAPPDPITPERVGAITCPALVVIGDQDFGGPGDGLAAAFRHGTLKVLRRTDHFATPESFAFVDCVLEFLEAVPA